VSHRARKSKGGEQREKDDSGPVWRWVINHEAMQRVSVLGVMDPETGSRAYWQPDLAINTLHEMMADPDFDREKYCSGNYACQRSLSARWSTGTGTPTPGPGNLRMPLACQPPSWPRAAPVSR
jgi:hypothetical protein